MKEFIAVLRRFVPPYKHYLVWSVVFNILSAVLNIFSFMAIIPILQILFQTGDDNVPQSLMPWSWDNLQETFSNNANYYVGQLIQDIGPTTTLLVIGIFHFEDGQDDEVFKPRDASVLGEESFQDEFDNDNYRFRGSRK